MRRNVLIAYLSSMAPKFSNPGPIGLFSFGISTFLLMLKILGLPNGADNILFSCCIIIGGATQLIAGILEWVVGNLFSSVAFMLFGSFWIAFISAVRFLDDGSGSADLPLAMFIWFYGILCVGLTLCTFAPGMPRLSRMIFISASILFFLIGGSHLLAHFESKATRTVEVIGAIDGIFCSLLVLYEAIGVVVNYYYKREFMPFGPRMPEPKSKGIKSDVSVELKDTATRV
eukprot:gnl/Dysnectes_brevis/1343_a1507_4021.p1 GENE.gnl/Dysnectes_brevis/1343_a1507_4021~~gnl/Dysnectes_brevis/1343_a1507_4021.p1  ORF type:complete len:230 (+),score=44.90 gnl/Dysnectes_brevis/1343_a1507_4021:3-692(+)